MRAMILIATAFVLTSAGSLHGQITFNSVDIGSQTPAGQTIAVDGGYDVSSATGDVWGALDDFRFVYRQVQGDFDLRARIVSFTGAAFWSKAGLMVRDELSEFGVNGFMIATRSSAWGRYMFSARLEQFYGTYVHSQGSFEKVSYPNVWVRIVRIGNVVIPMHSTNGVDWTQVGNRSFSYLPKAAFVGLAVSNHPDSGTTKATAQFRDIALDAGAPVAPAILTQPISQIVNPGMSPTFSVSVLGRGTLTYQWFRDGAAIDNATNAAVTLDPVALGAPSKFTCLVRNEFGEMLSWTGLLEIEEPQHPFDGILLERYSSVYGRRVEYMINATNYPGAPAGTSRPSFFEVSGMSDDTGARLRGYVTAPLTGDYTFYIAADDRGELWLSNADDPASRRQIALCYYYVNPREWEHYLSQASAPIQLAAGQRYYLEAFVKGDGSPNQGAVGWQLPDGTYERPIAATRFRGVAGTLHSISHDAPDYFQFEVNGTANSLYMIQSSSDLVTWTALLTNRVPFVFEDAGIATDAQHFYRAATSR